MHGLERRSKSMKRVSKKGKKKPEAVNHIGKDYVSTGKSFDLGFRLANELQERIETGSCQPQYRDISAE
jgi:hypothetical protein